jgi:hypothetical protein
MSGQLHVSAALPHAIDWTRDQMGHQKSLWTHWRKFFGRLSRYFNPQTARSSLLNKVRDTVTGGGWNDKKGVECPPISLQEKTGRANLKIWFGVTLKPRVERTWYQNVKLWTLRSPKDSATSVPVYKPQGISFYRGTEQNSFIAQKACIRRDIAWQLRCSEQR